MNLTTRMSLERIIIFIFLIFFNIKVFCEDIHLLCRINFTNQTGQIVDQLTYHLKLMITSPQEKGKCEVMFALPDDKWIIDGSGYALIRDDEYKCESVMTNPLVEGTHPVSLFIVNRFTGAVESKATKEQSYFGKCEKLNTLY